MAVLNQRLYRYNGSSYDTIHFEAGADNITGTLPVAHGGTGSTTAAGARSNLEITPANIGAAASSHSHSEVSTAIELQTFNANNVSHGSSLWLFRVRHNIYNDGRFGVVIGDGSVAFRADYATESAYSYDTPDGQRVTNWISYIVNNLIPSYLALAGGTMTGNAIMKTGTDYTTYRARNIAANTTAFTAGTSALTNGNIYLQYE